MATTEKYNTQHRRGHRRENDGGLGTVLIEKSQTTNTKTGGNPGGTRNVLVLFMAASLVLSQLESWLATFVPPVNSVLTRGSSAFATHWDCRSTIVSPAVFGLNYEEKFPINTPQTTDSSYGTNLEDIQKRWLSLCLYPSLEPPKTKSSWFFSIQARLVQAFLLLLTHFPVF